MKARRLLFAAWVAALVLVLRDAAAMDRDAAGTDRDAAGMDHGGGGGNSTSGSTGGHGGNSSGSRSSGSSNGGSTAVADGGGEDAGAELDADAGLDLDLISSGCSCRTLPSGGASAGWLGAIVAATLAARRRSRGRRLDRESRGGAEGLRRGRPGHAQSVRNGSAGRPAALTRLIVGQSENA
jgi:hypothetical protein